MPSRRPRRQPVATSRKQAAADAAAAKPGAPADGAPRFAPLDSLLLPRAEQAPPVVALQYRLASSQHAALARLEAFYEGAGAPRGAYVRLSEAKGLCRNYEAFNLPLDAVRRWLASLREGEEEVPPEEEPRWWQTYCNEEENELLAYLEGMGALQPAALPVADAAGDDDKLQAVGSADASSTAAPTPSGPSYLISVLTLSALPHELSHALFHLSPVFARAAMLAWEGLPRKSRSIIEHDLRLRGYAPEVWVDEFQAYIAENDAEFGQAAREACAEAERELAPARRQAKIDVGVR